MNKPTLFYYSLNNEQQGPFPTSEIPSMLQAGKVRPDSMVWAEGMADWMQLKEAFKDILPSPPPLKVALVQVPKIEKVEIDAKGDKKNSCHVCGALVDLKSSECECCGVSLNGQHAESSCPDCNTKTYVGQWYCVECYSPLAKEDKKFLKVIEKHAYKMNQAFIGVPSPIREILETGEESLEFMCGTTILSNKRIFTYGDPDTTERWAMMAGGAIGSALFLAAIFGWGGFFCGLVVGFIGGSVVASNTYGDTKAEILKSTKLEDITSSPDAKSAHYNNSSSYWVDFDSLQGRISVNTGDFDTALTLARRINDAMNAHASDEPLFFHKYNMILRRMKAKGLKIPGALEHSDDVAA
jgi:hypothetical protein